MVRVGIRCSFRGISWDLWLCGYQMVWVLDGTRSRVDIKWYIWLCGYSMVCLVL